MAHTKKTTAGNVNNGTANTFSYSGSFDVFKASEVEVELDNVKLTFTTSTINESASPREYTVDYDNKTVHVGGADLASTNSVVIQPVTDMGSPTPRATYSPGSSVTSADLNNNQLQLMRKALEYDEQKLSSRGGTMTGNLHFGKNVDLSFEGDTDNDFETTITVADPTSDKTITFPDTTGTVVTTGDTGTVTATMLAANSVDSSELVDGSIDTSHIADSQVTAAKLASSAVTTVKLATNAVTTAKITDANVTKIKLAGDCIDGTKLADNAVDSEHYVDGSIDTAHIADSQVTTAKIADSNVTTAKIAADAITGAKIADDAVNSEHLAAGSIDHEHLSNNCVQSENIVNGAIAHEDLANNCIQSENIVDGAIATADIGDTQVTDAKLASNSVTTAKITDANVTTNKIANDAITIGKIGCEQTTITDSDSHIPTSGAVVDYVAAQIAPIGGLEVIADEDNFPTSQPNSGVVISISDAAGIVVNGSGVSTTARTAGNGSDNVTINNFPSSLYGETLATGVGLMVSSTGSSQTYNYHKILTAETDVKQLSDDINDFNARYRVNAGEPGSNNDTGDLVFDTNASKMKVYDGSSWGEVTSTGDFKYLFLCPAGGSGAPTLNGNIATYDLRESSNSGSAASVSSAAQLIVSINGVIQKANTGTSAPAEGFALVDANTIIFGANLASGDSVFIVQIGSAVSIPTPGDATVSAAKIASGAVETAKIADGAVTEGKIASASVSNSKLTNSSVDSNKLAVNSVVTAKITDANVTTAKIADEAVTLAKLEHGTSSNDGKFLRANNGADPSYESIPAGVGGATGVTFNDGVKAEFGTGGDLDMWHTGSEANITNGTGNLKIGCSNNIEINTFDGHAAAKFINDGAVELYHNNVKKVETTADGIKLPDAGKLSFNDVSYIWDNNTNNNTYWMNPSNSTYIDIADASKEFAVTANSTAEAMIKGIPDAQVELYHNGTKRLDTTSTGVAIHNTSSPQTGASSAANDLVVSGDGAMGMTLHTNSTSSNCSIFFSDTDNNSPGAIQYLHNNDQIRFYVNNNYSTPAMQWNSDLTIYFNGDMYSNGNSYSTGSDLRMKSNLVQFTNTLDNLKQITGYKFDIKCGGGDKTRKSAGLIAQDVEKVYPDFVAENPETGMKSLEYNTFIGVLVEAVKELTTKVETLETKVAALEAA